jgi:hypothetical protein
MEEVDTSCRRKVLLKWAESCQGIYASIVTLPRTSGLLSFFAGPKAPLQNAKRRFEELWAVLTRFLDGLNRSCAYSYTTDMVRSIPNINLRTEIDRRFTIQFNKK